MTMQKKAQQGFTLIELMIVIAIVGILAAIALPAYQDYIVRSKMTEPLAVLAEAKTAVSEYVATNAKIPDDNVKYGVKLGDRDVTNSPILANLTIFPEGAAGVTGKQQFRLVATVRGAVWGGDTDLAFSLSGSTNLDGTMTWECLPGDEGGRDSNNIDTKYLPANCRG